MIFYTVFILCYFSLATAAQQFQYAFSNDQRHEHALRLKHVYHHASVQGPIPGLFRKQDIPSFSVMSESHLIQSTLGVIDRPTEHDINTFLNADRRWPHRMRSMYLESSIALLPRIDHRESVISLAQMTNNAYLDINLNETEWYDLGSEWQVNQSFGWESDGIRGHIFTNQDDSLVVVSIKGTSAGLWTGGPTGEKDKLNDNALFSCCCARISRAWSPVCDCYRNNDYVCENSCLEHKISESELYYDNAMTLYKDVLNTYPNSTVWLTGHSLGGALASLVGQTYGVPTVTFEIPGDRLASSRLHLPSSPGAKNPIWHFGHTADPIFVGVCTGPASTCWYGGYAMESRCHTGKVCVWDTVEKHNWRVDIRSHRVRDVIEGILLKPDEFPMPKCVQETDCEDCGLWSYYDKRDPLDQILSTHSQTPYAGYSSLY